MESKIRLHCSQKEIDSLWEVGRFTRFPKMQSVSIKLSEKTAPNWYKVVIRYGGKDYIQEGCYSMGSLVTALENIKED